MSAMKRLLDEDQSVRWTVLPTISPIHPSYRLMENIGAEGSHLWIERKIGDYPELIEIANRNNKEGYITPASKLDAANRAAFRVMDKWNSTLELAKCTITKSKRA